MMYFNPFATEMTTLDGTLFYVEVATDYEGDPGEDPKEYNIQVLINSLPEDWLKEEDNFTTELFLKQSKTGVVLIEKLYLTYTSKTNIFRVIGESGNISKKLYTQIVDFLLEEYGSSWGNSIQ